jgi:copper chaperone CopZ
MFAALLTINMLADNVKFQIKNMKCENCAKRIEKVLSDNGAVTKVKVNLECKAVCVSYDATKTNVEALQKALTDAKFQAEIVKQCNKEGGCKHDGKDGEHKCSKKDGQQEEKHECGGEGCDK